jgi:hypothetical protein
LDIGGTINEVNERSGFKPIWEDKSMKER